MKKFSDLGIKAMEERNIFPVPLISISEIINCEIEVLDYETNVTTRHGDGRYIIKIRYEEVERKFFTNSKDIKQALDKIPKSEFPFLTTIKQQSFGSGSGKIFYFT